MLANKKIKNWTKEHNKKIKEINQKLNDSNRKKRNKKKENNKKIKDVNKKRKKNKSE